MMSTQSRGMRLFFSVLSATCVAWGLAFGQETLVSRTNAQLAIEAGRAQQGETFVGGQAAIKNTIGIGPRAGFYKSYDAAEGTWYVGLQSRARLSPYFGVEAAAEYRARERFDYSRQDTIPASADVRYVPLTVSGMLFLPVAFNFVPYAFGGGGWYYTIIDYDDQPDITGDQRSSNFGYHFGFGLELPFSEHVAINADYRWNFLETDFDIGTPSTLDPQNSDGYTVSGSLMVYF